MQSVFEKYEKYTCNFNVFIYVYYVCVCNRLLLKYLLQSINSHHDQWKIVSKIVSVKLRNFVAVISDKKNI